MKKKKELILKIILFMLTIIPIIYFLFNSITGIGLINSGIELPAYYVCTISIIIWLIIAIKSKPQQKKTLKIVLLSVLICIILLFLTARTLFFYFFENREIKKFTSPTGKNELVVFESGFIDAIYYAYPVKCKWFYQEQENGYVSNHDDWGGAEAKVDWVTDNKAIVKFMSGFEIPNEGTNPNNEIIVEFK